jgi:Flp pilus assembly protein TadG
MKNRKGVAAVEFAVVLPLFVIMIVGMTEVGMAVMTQQKLTNIAREGARNYAMFETKDSKGVTLTGTTDSALACIQTACNNENIPYASLKVSPQISTSSDGSQAVSITVALPFSTVAIFTPTYFSGDLTASTTMRKEQ